MTVESGLAAFPVQEEVPSRLRPHAGAGNEPSGTAWRDGWREQRMTSTGGTGHLLEVPGDDYTAFFAEPAGGSESAEHRMWAFFGRLWSQAGPAVFPEAVPADRTEWAGYEARRNDWANRRRAALLKRHREDRLEREQRLRQSGVELPPDSAPDFEEGIREFALGVLRTKREAFGQRRELLKQADAMSAVIASAESMDAALVREYIGLVQSAAPLDVDRAATLMTGRQVVADRLAWARGQLKALYEVAEQVTASIKADATAKVDEYLLKFSGLTKWRADMYVGEAFGKVE